ncbi:PAS domain-containing protein [Acidisoma cellulosilytica]|uniref:histidine kinase n=1 Tax=Acidisoma cellulosilyticum TaxID=2802395 RepID=A0A964E501_9PROT|nr:PAS domain-containing protein [Acidisoma cellulosilyticum]MCB8881984.1 PAS domain-containing protein [Acidisoma cellulosilyticum]
MSNTEHSPGRSAAQPSPGAAIDALADWPATPLGDVAHWPPALLAAAILVQDLPGPALVAWGSALTVLPNPRLEALLKVKGAGLRLDLVLADAWEWLHPLVTRALAGEPTQAGILPLARGADAVLIHGTVAISPLRAADGAIAGLLVQLDPDARPALPPTSLTDSEAHYRTLFEAMDEGFCVIEFFDGPHGALSDYIHVDANPAYAVHAGIPNVVGQTLREIVPNEADAWVARYGAVLATGQPIRFEQELVATGHYLEVSSFRIEPPSRRQVAVLFKDITDRKRIERVLREVNETLGARVVSAVADRQLLAGIVENTHAFVHVLDMEMRYLAVNAAAAQEFERVFGVLPRVGDRIAELLAEQPDLLADVQTAWARAYAGEDYVIVDEYGDPSRDRRYYEQHFSPLRDAKGQLIGAYQFGYDVTDRLAEQDRLRVAEESLRQAQKMEAVGQLTGGLAHDFNNLLAGISGSFEMIGIRAAQGRTADVEKYIAAGQGAARRAASLTHRLLAFARRQTLSPKPTVINKLLSDLVELVQRTVGPAIAVETIAAGGLWTAQVDANQLENAILNLCINARDAMADGGRITIETSNRWLDERTARERNMVKGQYVAVSVTDTGSGIDKSILDRVFDPFFTTKPIGQGTGLGLSMVYGFARQSHGQVRIYSELDQGTTVTIYLPRHHGAQDERETVEPAHAPRLNYHGETVLIVDDEPTVRLLVADALGDLGYHCIEAEDGATALKIFEGEPDINLLITDVGLPGGLNGRQVADAARAIRSDLRVLFITGYAENAVLNHGHIEPGMEVLTKPFSIDDLIRRVERMLGEAKAGGGGK